MLRILECFVSGYYCCYEVLSCVFRVQMVPAGIRMEEVRSDLEKLISRNAIKKKNCRSFCNCILFSDIYLELIHAASISLKSNQDSCIYIKGKAEI